MRHMPWFGAHAHACSSPHTLKWDCQRNWASQSGWGNGCQLGLLQSLSPTPIQRVVNDFFLCFNTSGKSPATQKSRMKTYGK
ncbi:hypothetical protein SKAU_G00227010 [Synaphobranchus kaupii]|uniref:Uncharacterized protein n=1 Tax=Synaphobranchus kaupii TaxID=118154 RepID=A0A9Q1F535_SYNKA|nr:hypothetical protein SKAU_G00227010 [Synaphobranchus kaupii]